MSLDVIVIPASTLMGAVVIVGILLTWGASTLVSASMKKRSQANTPPVYQPSQPYSPPQGQHPPQPKDNTAIIWVLAMIVAVLVVIVIPVSMLIRTIVIVGILLTWGASTLVSASMKKRSQANTPPVYQPSQPYSPPQGQHPPQPKDNTAIVVAIIGALATIVAALITALMR